MVIRYARASTSGQNIDDQTGALKQVDLERIFAETASGASAKGGCRHFEAAFLLLQDRDDLLFGKT